MKTQLLFILLIIPLITKAQIITDGTLGHSVNLPGPDYQIGADLGRQMGGNLFHSFQDFNLNSFESATFFGPNHIQNVISRVTGGNPSNIDGLIRSTIPNADFYFLNPYGIMFGPNAQLDVQGSFHASTADYLRLGENGRFDARNPSDSLLTIAPIASFGFLTDSPASLSIESSQLTTPEEKTLSFISGDITINQAELTASFGQINFASVASKGEVKLGGNFVDVSSFSQLADIHIKENSLLQTSGEGGGNIFIRGGQFVADNSAIKAKTLGSQDGGVIDIQANNVLLATGATINGTTEGAGKGSNINVQASDSIMVVGEKDNNNPNIFDIESSIVARSGIRFLVNDDDLGDSGSIQLEAKNISFKNGGYTSVSTYGGGKGGDLNIKASESVSFMGEGSSFGAESQAAVASYSGSDKAGNSGNLLIEAKNISLTDGGFIAVNTQGKGNAGTIKIQTTNLKIRGVNREDSPSSIRADVNPNPDTIYNTNNIANGGTILIEAQDILLTERGQIRADTSADTNASNIFIKAQDITLTDGSLIGSISFGAGNAGNIQINATGTLTITGAESQIGLASTINTSSSPYYGENIISGQGGNISIVSKDLIIKDGGQIDASSIVYKGSKGGKGGNIIIHVQGTAELSGVNPYGENQYGFGAGISARSIGVEDSGGDAGSIMLQAGSLIIENGAVIISSSNNNAQGGNIELDVRGSIQITGNAANIQLEEPSSSQLGYLQKFSPNKYNQSTSGIYANSEGKNDLAGQGGNIHLTAHNLSLKNTGKISTSSLGGGSAGNIVIKVAQLELDNSASIVSESTLPNNYRFNTKEERDGNILVRGDRIEVTDVGNGKPEKYINIGNRLVRIAPADTVADMAALEQLSNQYSFVNNDMVEVQDIGNGESAFFIYAEDGYGVDDWVKMDDKVTIAFENMSELNEIQNYWYSVYDEESVPYASGDLIKVKDAGDGKPATFVYSALTDGIWIFGQALRVNQFTVADITALHELGKTTSIQAMDTANIMGSQSQFIFNGQNWVKLNNMRTIADIAEMNTLTVAKTGIVAEVAQVETGQPSNFIYSGQQWLPMNNTGTKLTVANLTELNQLSAKSGDLVGVIDAGNGQYAHFFYTDSEWIKQIRGGDAGQIVINADKIQLTDGSEISTGSISGGGGSVTLNVDKLVFLNNSQVSTSVQEGVGSGGDLTITGPQFVIMNNGKIIAQANEGRGGNIHLGSKQLVKSPCSQISASSRLGLDGNVQIDSPAVDLDAMLVVLPGGRVEAQLKTCNVIEELDNPTYTFEVKKRFRSPPLMK